MTSTFYDLAGPKIKLYKWNLRSEGFHYVLYYHWLVRYNAFAYWYPRAWAFYKITTFRLLLNLEKPNVDEKYRVHL